MPDSQSSGEMMPNTPEGWTFDDPTDYQFLTSQDPPRRGSIFKVLKGDARSAQVRRYWITGLGLVGVGVASIWVGVGLDMSWHSVLLGLGLVAAIFGGRVLLLWFGLFRSAVRTVRLGPLLRGEICSLGTPSLASGYSRTVAWLPDSRSVLVNVQNTLASELLEQYGRAEVLLLANQDETLGKVIAIRPVTGDRRDVAAPESEE
jgi:hypothetical protein